MVKLKKGEYFTVAKSDYKLNGIYQFVRKNNKTIIARKNGKICTIIESDKIYIEKRGGSYYED